MVIGNIDDYDRKWDKGECTLSYLTARALVCITDSFSGVSTEWEIAGSICIVDDKGRVE
jgi:hypothetical protein